LIKLMRRCNSFQTPRIWEGSFASSQLEFVEKAEICFRKFSV